MLELVCAFAAIGAGIAGHITHIVRAKREQRMHRVITDLRQRLVYANVVITGLANSR